MVVSAAWFEIVMRFGRGVRVVFVVVAVVFGSVSSSTVSFPGERTQPRQEVDVAQDVAQASLCDQPQ